MTQEQFDKANNLQNKIKYLEDKNDAFEKVIDRLKKRYTNARHSISTKRCLGCDPYRNY